MSLDTRKQTPFAAERVQYGFRGPMLHNGGCDPDAHKKGKKLSFSRLHADCIPHFMMGPRWHMYAVVHLCIRRATSQAFTCDPSKIAAQSEASASLFGHAVARLPDHGVGQASFGARWVMFKETGGQVSLG